MVHLGQQIKKARGRATHYIKGIVAHAFATGTAYARAGHFAPVPIIMTDWKLCSSFSCRRAKGCLRSALGAEIFWPRSGQHAALASIFTRNWPKRYGGAILTIASKYRMRGTFISTSVLTTYLGNEKEKLRICSATPI